VCGVIIAGTIVYVVAVHRRRAREEAVAGGGAGPGATGTGAGGDAGQPMEAQALLQAGGDAHRQHSLGVGLPPTPFTAFMMGAMGPQQGGDVGRPAGVCVCCCRDSYCRL
jgi:hypothetical protein